MYGAKCRFCNFMYWWINDILQIEVYFKEYVLNFNIGKM